MAKSRKSGDEKTSKKKPIEEISLSEIKKKADKKKPIEEMYLSDIKKMADKKKTIEEKVLSDLKKIADKKNSSQEIQQKPKGTSETKRKHSKKSEKNQADTNKKEEKDSHRKKDEKRDESPKKRQHKDSNRKNVQPQDASLITESFSTKSTRSKKQRDNVSIGDLPIEEIIPLHQMTQKNLETEAKRLKESQISKCEKAAAIKQSLRHYRKSLTVENTAETEQKEMKEKEEGELKKINETLTTKITEILTSLCETRKEWQEKQAITEKYIHEEHLITRAAIKENFKQWLAETTTSRTEKEMSPVLDALPETLEKADEYSLQNKQDLIRAAQDNPRKRKETTIQKISKRRRTVNADQDLSSEIDEPDLGCRRILRSSRTSTEKESSGETSKPQQKPAMLRDYRNRNSHYTDADGHTVRRQVFSEVPEMPVLDLSQPQKTQEQQHHKQTPTPAMNLTMPPQAHQQQVPQNRPRRQSLHESSIQLGPNPEQGQPHYVQPFTINAAQNRQQQQQMQPQQNQQLQRTPINTEKQQEPQKRPRRQSLHESSIQLGPNPEQGQQQYVQPFTINAAQNRQQQQQMQPQQNQQLQRTPINTEKQQEPQKRPRRQSLHESSIQLGPNPEQGQPHYVQPFTINAAQNRQQQQQMQPQQNQQLQRTPINTEKQQEPQKRPRRQSLHESSIQLGPNPEQGQQQYVQPFTINAAHNRQQQRQMQDQPIPQEPQHLPRRRSVHESSFQVPLNRPRRQSLHESSIQFGPNPEQGQQQYVQPFTINAQNRQQQNQMQPQEGQQQQNQQKQQQQQLGLQRLSNTRDPRSHAPQASTSNHSTSRQQDPELPRSIPAFVDSIPALNELIATRSCIDMLRFLQREQMRQPEEISKQHQNQQLNQKEQNTTTMQKQDSQQLLQAAATHIPLDTENNSVQVPVPVSTQSVPYNIPLPTVPVQHRPDEFVEEQMALLHQEDPDAQSPVPVSSQSVPYIPLPPTPVQHRPAEYVPNVPIHPTLFSGRVDQRERNVRNLPTQSILHNVLRQNETNQQTYNYRSNLYPYPPPGTTNFNAHPYETMMGSASQPRTHPSTYEHYFSNRLPYNHYQYQQAKRGRGQAKRPT